MFQNKKLNADSGLSSSRQHQEHIARLVVLTLKLPKIILGLKAQGSGLRAQTGGASVIGGGGQGMAGSSGDIYPEFGIPFSRYRFWKTQFKRRRMGERMVCLAMIA